MNWCRACGVDCDGDWCTDHYWGQPDDDDELRTPDSWRMVHQ